MTRVLRLSRLSPLILLAAALVALAVFFVNYAPPASADHGSTRDVWAATLAAGSPGGCDNASTGSECSSTSVLTDDDFTHAGVDYAIASLTVDNGTLGFTLDKAIPTAIRSDGTLHVNGSLFRLADATFAGGNVSASWANTGLSWSVGDTVQVKLTAPYWTGVDLYGGGLVHSSNGDQTLDIPTAVDSNTFLVRLDQAPTADVTITLEVGPTPCEGCGDFKAATATPETLTFTSSNWQTGQTVTVSAVTNPETNEQVLVPVLAKVSIDDSADANDPYRSPERVNSVWVFIGSADGPDDGIVPGGL